MTAQLDQILDIIEHREKLMKDAEQFLNLHEDKNGNLTADDAKTYKFMREQIDKCSASIDLEVGRAKAYADPKYREMMKALRPAGPISNYDIFDGASGEIISTHGKPRTSAEYDRHFFNALRGNFRNESTEYLREGVDSQGGYLLPSEMDESISTKLSEENPMRQICRVIETNSRHEIPILANQPTAQWIGEGAKIDLQSGNFERVILGAFKLCAAVNISNELLQDSYYNLQEFFVEEFSKSMAASEEQAFVNGNGITEPQGFLTALNAATDIAVATTTAGNNLTIDDLINVVYSLQRAYRQGACWLMHDSTIQAIRKIKDSSLQMYWTASTTEGEPPLLLGYPVYSSSFMPQYASGANIAAFGNFNHGYIIGDRSQRTFKALFELLALNDLSAFLAVERVDGALIDKESIKVLRLK